VLFFQRFKEPAALHQGSNAVTNAESKNAWEAYKLELVQTFRTLPDTSKDWTIPFVPWCGEEYWNTKPRILFVGKSVGAFNDPDAERWMTPLHTWRKTGHPDPAWIASNYIKSSIRTFDAASPAFWTIPLLMTSAFVPYDLPPEKLSEVFAWSNLYKVNSLRLEGLPDDQDLSCPYVGVTCQRESFCLIHSSLQWLRREIEILQPDFVLLGITYEWERIAKLFPQPRKDELTFPRRLTDSELTQLSPNCTPTAIWVTYHFSQWNRNCEHGKLLLEMRQLFEHPARGCGATRT